MPNEPTPVGSAEEPSELLAATYAATLVDEWVRQGVVHAVVCPGSRSTPLAVALAAHDGLAVHVQHDERSAGFMGLGIGLATGQPAVVLTTSGTAAVELHPAVVEADLAAVPLLAVTADRPPELRGVGAPQTIDQRELYGPSVRWFADPGPPSGRGRDGWRRLAADAVAATVGPVPGPVHLNVAFREPLVGRPGPLAPVDESTARSEPEPVVLTEAQLSRLVEEVEDRNGIIVAGVRAARSPAAAAAVSALAARLGWPVLADHLSGCRRDSPEVVTCFDAMLRIDEVATALRPEVVLRLGGLLASRVTNDWLAGLGVRQFAVDPTGRAPDPDAVVTERLWADIGDTCAKLDDALARLELPAERQWLDQWRAAERLAVAAVESTMATSGGLTEPGAARAALAAVPHGGTLVVSSSMPVRDLEWYSPAGGDLRVVANRGANGIDGVVSTAVGVALASGPVVCLVGDVAFLHDASALMGVTRRGVDLAIVVVDNDGGGIFSFLPQASALEPARFEQLFGTPHGTDLAAVGAAHGLVTTVVTTHAGLEAALVGWRDRRGPALVVARSDRAANAEFHGRLNAAVAAALRSVP
jgi:2-succinyl-5-enolpyruvyl-6-hydroxy-3-cyclohexene-1-carboxylate synthase